MPEDSGTPASQFWLKHSHGGKLSPGEHTVRVEAAGQGVWTRTLTVTIGSNSTVQAVLSPME
jgi:hypothetical protein